MYKDLMPEMSRLRREEYAAEARRRARAQDFEGPTARSRWARRLFDAAFALDAEESWRAVWDRMSGEPAKSGPSPGKKG